MAFKPISPNTVKLNQRANKPARKSTIKRKVRSSSALSGPASPGAIPLRPSIFACSERKTFRGGIPLSVIEISIASSLFPRSNLKRQAPLSSTRIVDFHPSFGLASQGFVSFSAHRVHRTEEPDEVVKQRLEQRKGASHAELGGTIRCPNSVSNRPPHEALSNREYQVMLLIGAGKALKEIGDELSFSVKTVGTYRTRILEKLNLKNNAELMRYVLELELS
jgi:two-component system, NarL family, invasion response regulator UvrY